VVCHNREQADCNRAVRERLVSHLAGLIDGSDGWGARRRDELVGQLRTKPGLRRFLRRTKTGLLRIDRPASPGKPTWTASDCCALRPHPHPGRLGRLQAADRGRTRLAG
jgi:hypothetical protein